MDFEWDEAKSEANVRKHGVAFEDAKTVFADTLSVTGYDPKHSDDEDRYITVGQSADGKVLIISHTDRGATIRIISARVTTRAERKDYEDGSFP